MVLTGVLALKGIVSKKVYKLFCALSVAFSILVNEKLVEKHLDHAKKLLIYYVEKGTKLFGPSFPTYNTHCLVHIADDAEKYGSVSYVGAYKGRHQKTLVTDWSATF